MILYNEGGKMKTPNYQKGGSMDKYRAAISKMSMEQLQKAASGIEKEIKSGKMSKEQAAPLMQMMQARAKQLQGGK